MLKKIVHKIFGKRNSMQRSLMRSFIIAIVLVAILTIVEFSVLVVPKMQDKLIEINIRDKEQIDSLIYVTRKICGFAILNIVIISAVLVRINLKNIFRPIEQINEATKKVALGEYDIELESKREDEIGELTNNFNKMTHGLKSTENLQKEFINNVSHEIKTPVSSIEGFAKFLKDKNLTQEEREEYANIIIEEAKRLENLTGKILKLSKLNNQEIITNKQEIEEVYNVVYGNEDLNNLVTNWIGDKKMILTFPNLKTQDKEGNMIYFDMYVGNIKPYYYKFNSIWRGDLVKILKHQEVEKNEQIENQQ